jgi:hypothetical protein
METYLVNVTEKWTKVVVHDYKKKGKESIELDVLRGDKVFITREEAENYAKYLEEKTVEA